MRFCFDRINSFIPNPAAVFQTCRNRNLFIHFTRLAALVLTGLSLFLTASAAPGDLDPAFGTGGKVQTNFNGWFDAGWDVAVQTDGKIVTAGVTWDQAFDQVIALARYNPDGSPDPSFGTGGQVTTGILAFFNWNVFVKVQTDGKVVVAGTYSSGFGSHFAVARFNGDGSPDASFGSGGKVIADPFADNEEALGLALQPDGKIVIAGAVQQMPTVYDFALVRFEPDGSYDATFGTGGSVRTDFGGSDRANGLAIQTDGKIIAAGGTATSIANGDFALARYEPDGSLDVTFGAGGKVVTDISGYDQASSVAVQTDGKIVAAGGAGRFSTATADFAAVRYHPDGTPDAAFGAGGKATTDFFNALDFANDVLIQPDGRIVLAGSINSDLLDVELHVDFGLARYEPDGTPDPTFGTGGKVSTDFGNIDEAGGIAMLSNCNIVVSGYSWQADAGVADFTLAGYESGVDCGIEPPPATACPLTHGYWKNHPDLWPVDSLTLGGQVYTKAELLDLLSVSTQTDASLVLAKQLIAAKLNIVNGSDPAPVENTIVHADGVLSVFGGKLPYKVKSSSQSGQIMATDANLLDSYNKGELTPDCVQ